MNQRLTSQKYVFNLLLPAYDLALSHFGVEAVRDVEDDVLLADILKVVSRVECLYISSV